MKTDCPWAMYVEEAQNADGEIVFMVSNMADNLVNHTNSVNDNNNKYLQNQHNHPLVESASAKMAFKYFRHIPEQLHGFADNLSDARMMPSKSIAL